MIYEKIVKMVEKKPTPCVSCDEMCYGTRCRKCLTKNSKGQISRININKRYRNKKFS